MDSSILKIISTLLAPLWKPVVNWIFKSRNKQKSIFKSLDNSIYISEYTQGERLDRLYLVLNTKGADKVVGKFMVNFEDDFRNDNPERKRLTEMTVWGQFFYDSVLLLNTNNAEEGSRHVAVLLLTHNSEKGFDGSYLVSHNPVPEKRKNQNCDIENVGRMNLKRIKSMQAAKKFVLFEDAKLWSDY